MSRPIRTSEILFPTLSTNFSDTLSSLKRSTLSISNRLRSVDQDSDFVRRVADAYGLPLVANERCGSWYIPPTRKEESAYFKSTDGHTGQWAFSLRRLNTQVLHVVAQHNGCVIVDSTRRGKRMPDALSKTVPIWCAVFNRVLFPNQPEAHALYTPPQVVSPSEHSQIEALLGEFTKQCQSLDLPLDGLRTALRKPLRPVWVTPETDLSASPPMFTDSYPVVLCTASRRVPGGEVSEGGYVQGAGDDSEGWAHGLTAQLYWAHREDLMRTSEDDLPRLIESIVEASGGMRCIRAPALILPTTGLFVSVHESVDSPGEKQYDGIIHCSEKADHVLAERLRGRYLHLECANGKPGSRDLRKELPKIEGFLDAHAPLERLLVTCSTGIDISVGVALTVLSLYVDDRGHIHPQRIHHRIEKPFIRQRLSWIMTSHPSANPSRATLQSANAYLMSAPPPNAAASSTSRNDAAAASPSTPSPSLAHRIFTSLRGRWTLERTVASALPTSPSGAFRGTATFSPRAARPATAGPSSECLYAEEGTFTTAAGVAFPARRQYVWRYAAASDAISVFFAREQSEAEERFFHTLEFAREPASATAGVRPGGAAAAARALVEQHVKASGGHWCEPDDYAVGYDFWIAEDGIGRFGIRYVVKGPRKDYISQAWYCRESNRPTV